MHRPNLLVSANSAYVMPLAVMLTSLFENNSAKMDVYLLWSELSAAELAFLEQLTATHGSQLIPVEINPEAFQGAPTLKYISAKPISGCWRRTFCPIRPTGFCGWMPISSLREISCRFIILISRVILRSPAPMESRCAKRFAITAEVSAWRTIKNTLMPASCFATLKHGAVSTCRL